MLGVESSPFQEQICRSVAQDGGGAVSLGAKQITIFCIAPVFTGSSKNKNDVRRYGCLAVTVVCLVLRWRGW